MRNEINKTQIQELVNTLNDLHNVECRTEELYGEFVVVVDEKKDLEFARKFIGKYSDVAVELPMVKA